MAPRLSGLTGATLETAPTVCQTCVWWQTRGNREPDKRKWEEKAESEWGVWGSIYRDEDGRVLGSMQYGPSQLSARAARPRRPAAGRRGIAREGAEGRAGSLPASAGARPARGRLAPS